MRINKRCCNLGNLLRATGPHQYVLGVKSKLNYILVYYPVVSVENKGFYEEYTELSIH